MRLLLAAIAATAVLVVGAIAPAGGKQAEEPTDQVLAVISPIAAPACVAVGLSTVVVPLAGDQLGGALGGSVDVTTLLQQATGPVLVACGSIPSSDGTRCDLVDGPIELIWPAQLNDVGVKPLAPLGSVVETLTRLVGLGGLSELPDLGVEPALGCSIPVVPDGGAGDPVPPPEFPADPVAAADLPAVGGGSPSGVALEDVDGPLATAPPALGDVLVPASAVPGSPGLRGPMLAAAGVLAAGLLWFGARPRGAATPRR